MWARHRLFLMHQRNQAALEKLHRKDHDDEHEDIQQRLRQALADPSLPLRDRVRMACSLAAVFGGCSWPGTRSTTSPAPNSASWSGTRSATSWPTPVPDSGPG
jgi:hypothetical protein